MVMGTKQDIDRIAIVMLRTVFVHWIMCLLILPPRGKAKIERLFFGPDINERTTLNVPSGSISTRTRICFCSRARCKSRSRAGVTAVTAVPLIANISLIGRWTESTTNLTKF